MVPKIGAWGYILLKRELKTIANDTRYRKKKIKQQYRVRGNKDLNTNTRDKKICIKPNEVYEHKKQPDDIRDQDLLLEQGNAQST